MSRNSQEVSHEATVSLESDGAVSVLDRNGEVVGGYLSPWAVDANDATVETSFSLQGNALVQTIKFDETTAFPVFADPQWWQASSALPLVSSREQPETSSKTYLLGME
ncbi:hypothetical protein ART_2709 [Arthrobacter sp. PAMC 25486]|nr:hypothetical protein ART_2709 [Arthrobacter sp. PAMC 25486]